MRQILAALRLTTIIFVLVLGTLLVLLLGLVPMRTRSGGRLATVPVGWMARSFLWVFNIRLDCSDRQRLSTHAGMIVCNHLSYADVAVLLSVTPVRFLSAAGVRRLPVIGWLAIAIETVFVHRGDQSSREQVRQEISQRLQAQPLPPIIIFPEGGTGPGKWLLPFRHGTFEIAMESQVPVLPCAIVYDPLAAFHYFDHDDTLLKAAWRLALQPSTKRVTLIPLTPLDSAGYSEASSFALDAEQAIAGSLGIEVGVDRERFA